MKRNKEAKRQRGKEAKKQRSEEVFSRDSSSITASIPKSFGTQNDDFTLSYSKSATVDKSQSHKVSKSPSPILLSAFCFLLFFFTSSLCAQSLFINEIVASNSNTILDEDGEAPDWIELYNAESVAVDLQSFGLSDDPADPYKWEFPDISIAPQDFLLVFASGKNRTAGYWQNIIDWGDIWKYFVGTEEPPADWRQIDFDDSDWEEGPSGFGYGDGDDATIIPPTLSCYIRKVFTLDDLEDIVSAVLHVDYDDGFVAYLNDVEIASMNILSPGVIPAYNDSTYASHEAQIYQGGFPETFYCDNVEDILQPGDNVLAIQVHNISINSSDMSMIPFFTLGYDAEPANLTGVPTILETLLPHLHTNFKISADGEPVLLSDSGGLLLDDIDLPALPTNISFGRQPDGTENWFYFNETTPDSSNTTTGYLEFAPDPILDPHGGLYNDPVTITFLDIPADISIFYTLNGSEPNTTHYQYTSPILLDSTAVVRARAFGTGKIPSRIITNSYFIDINPTLPIISLSSEPDNFWDDEIGIYAMGNNASSVFPYYGANFWEDWERPVHIEMYEADGSAAFALDAGVRIFGNWTRGHPQKSLAIMARNTYSTNSIDYQIFDDKPISSFKNIVLRNSGNDWEYSMFRDMLMTGLVSDLDIDRQAHRSSIVFINGEYWGIHNIREKMNEHYLAANHGIDPDNIDLLENNVIAIHGDGIHYQAMLDFIENNDMTLPQNYDYVATKMDIDNFINYWLTEVYLLNGDWPSRNIKFWRDRTTDGKWRWLLFDTDFGFALWHSAYYNFLADLLDPDGPAGPGSEWSTFLFRSLIENEQFRRKFINYTADRLNTCFSTDFVLARIAQFQSLLQTEMESHKIRWEQSYDLWFNEILLMQWFADDRPEYMRDHIISELNLPGTANIYLDISPPGSGAVQVSSLEIDEFPWVGEYFLQNPVTLTGLNTPGWEFAGWSGDIISNETSIELDMNQEFSLIAWFEPAVNLQDLIVFNEINYNSAGNFNVGDWVEIYNNSGLDVDLSGWKFLDSDDTHIFEFPENFFLPDAGYYVLCQDTLAFQTFFPEVNNYVGNFDFGLSSSGELIRLFDHTGVLIDSVYYGSSAPWPPEPNGNGPTLALLNPGLDNSMPENWAASAAYGTPGEINDVYVPANENIVSAPQMQLAQNFPNPFNPETNISFSLPKSGNINLSVYNIRGQLVARLIDDFLEKGTHTISWESKDNSGKNVASGIYYYRLSDGNSSRTRKMLLLK